MYPTFGTYSRTEYPLKLGFLIFALFGINHNADIRASLLVAPFPEAARVQAGESDALSVNAVINKTRSAFMMLSAF